MNREKHPATSRLAQAENKSPRSTPEGEEPPNGLDRALGLRIRERREQQCLSRTMLAEAVGLTAQQIQTYEQGLERVSLSRLVDIGQALKCRAADLIGDLEHAGICGLLFRRELSQLGRRGDPELVAAYAALPAATRRAVINLMIKLAEWHDRECATTH